LKVNPFLTSAKLCLLNQPTDLEREGGSKKDAIQTAIIRVSRWKAACDVIQSRTDEQKIQKLESALKEMADALGAQAGGKSSRIPKGRLLAPVSTNDANFLITRCL